jgi:hypothetical protein
LNQQLFYDKPSLLYYGNRIIRTSNDYFVYEDAKWEETLELLDATSPCFNGAVFSQDRYAIEVATVKLQNAAGNFYINDKPTGAVVDNNHSVAQERLEQTTKQVLH